jgi:hypothetical protein
VKHALNRVASSSSHSTGSPASVSEESRAA